MKTKGAKTLHDNHQDNGALKDIDTLVIKPSDEELSAHQRFLEKIPGVEQFLIDNAKRRIINPK
jgi:hypothetical protein